ncbi:hypothetical protein ACH4Y0_11140 [Streptomyces sp. NPDC020707]|uniref:hypothetical protein n=1 Tax=Streptomyces sp. NPDC020707 TaxID=3365084 RepID=UPI0037A1FD65
MMTLAPQSARTSTDEDADVALRADCLADSAGGLTFDMAETGESGDTHLVLLHRDGIREVRLPLAPAADGRLRAALPSGVELPEGRWNAFAQTGDGEPQRLTPGLNDLRSLVDRVPSGARGHVAVRIPYATKHGNLSVRSWLRAPHAEAGELHIGQDGLGVHGQVYGVALTPDAYAESAGREGTGPVPRIRVHRDGALFRFTVDYGALPAGLWDLWLRPAGESGPRVRIARLLDDIADKKPIFTYPKVTLETADGPVTAGPYYTSDNDLSVAVTAAGA